MRMMNCRVENSGLGIDLGANNTLLSSAPSSVTSDFKRRTIGFRERLKKLAATTTSGGGDGGGGGSRDKSNTLSRMASALSRPIMLRSKAAERNVYSCNVRREEQAAAAAGRDRAAQTEADGVKKRTEHERRWQHGMWCKGHSL
jgi:hypothetical protein